MIKLDVMDICHRCKHFKADSEVSCLYADFQVYDIQTRVFCTHKAECENLVAMLSEQLEEK